jgi:hypothetical protein
MGDPRAWDHAPTDANVGILCGTASGGLVVLDFDEPDLCRRVLGMTPRSLGVLTVVVESSRGHHVYARHPGVATRVPQEGFSILGDGSLVVAPPSVHASGRAYCFMAEPRRIANLTEFADESILATEPADGAPSPAMEESAVETGSAEPVTLSEAAAVVERQHARVREAWRLLTTPLPEDVVFEGSGSDAWSRADFLVALCLIQHGHEPAGVARLLLALPGSKARVRGERYAARTCARAAATARTGKLPGRG